MCNVPGRFIMDPDGIVMAVEVMTEVVERNVDELIRQIQAMRAVKANPGMTAPAGWKPGDPLIKNGRSHRLSPTGQFHRLRVYPQEESGSRCLHKHVFSYIVEVPVRVLVSCHA